MRYLSAQIEAGAEVLQLFDSWAGVLPEPELHRWCFEPTRKIVTALRARHPHVPVIAFPRGIGAAYAASPRRFLSRESAWTPPCRWRWAARHLRREPSLVPARQSRSRGAAWRQGALSPRRDGSSPPMAIGRSFSIWGTVSSQETPPESVARLVDYLKSLDE